MKVRAIFISALIACGILTALFYGQAALPVPDQSSITQAIKEGNTPQVIKNLIGKMKEQLEVDQENYPSLIAEIENYAATCPDSASVAVLHSMIAEMYHQYYQQNSWNINQRTALSGYIPNDIREWSGNLFTAKIADELSLSLRPAAVLRQTPTSKFKEILTPGKDSPSLRPTLFDFLAYRAIEIQPSDSIYHELIQHLDKQSNPKAALMAKLDYLQYSYRNNPSESALDLYRSTLDSLSEKYASTKYSIEIQIAQLNTVSMHPGRYNISNNDSIKAIEYAICKEGISRFPTYERTTVLKNHLTTLEQPTLSVSTNNTAYPGKDFTFNFEYKNLPQATIRLYKSTLNAEQAVYANHRKGKTALGALVKEHKVSLTHPNTYLSQDTTLTFSLDQPGLYEYVISTPDQALKVNGRISVSQLAAVYRLQPNYEAEVLVTDFLSGKPVSNATVTYYKRSNNTLTPLGSLKTDRDGLAVLPANKQIEAFQAKQTGDAAGAVTFIYLHGRSGNQSAEAINYSLFTDRRVYRPGQTLFFKGIAYQKDSDTPHTLAGKELTVSLVDANRKEVATKTLTTNAFGSVHGEFTIPRQSLNGVFRLTFGNAVSYIHVEEYKRPTFKAELLPIQDEVAFGDSVTIRGKAETFSGVSLPTGHVVWRIIRRPFWLRNSFVGAMETQVAEGNTTLSPNGTFAIPFCPQKEELNRTSHIYQSYEIIATVTDSKGETGETRYVFNVGDTGLVLDLNLPQKADKDSVNASVNARTLNGGNVTIEGAFKIQSLTDTGRDHQGDFKEGALVASGTFTSGKQLPTATFGQLPSGRYRVSCESKDLKGRPVHTRGDIILYAKDDKRPPIFAHTWLLTEKTACLPGEAAKIVFGTSNKDTHILYEVFNGTRRVHRERIQLSDENRTFQIPFKQEYGDGIVASYTFLKEGRLYTSHVPIQRQMPDRSLTIKPITFRDRLLPGSAENWKFRITNADSTAVSAEVLAGMYDASLDKILPFSWFFSPRKQIDIRTYYFREGEIFRQNYQNDQAQVKYAKEPELQYDQINWQGLMNNWPRTEALYMTRGGMGMKSSINAMAPSMVKQAMDVAENMADDQIVAEAEIEESVPEIGQQPAANTVPQIRTNFNETAFFYPQLQTDEKGDLSLNFTLPESNTTWKLQMIAHTDNLKYGQLSRQIITSKPLMVLPSLPRFVREGDLVSISTQVINQSEKEIEGRVRIELFDPATNQPVICLSKAQYPFSLLPDSVETVSWSIPVPKATQLLGVRIVADSEQGSDGEQQILPVLTNQLLITESTPFFLIDEEELRITPATSQAGKQPFSLTLEMSGNPIWYAVQALPTISRPEHDNALSWFAAYYANTLAAHIAQNNPRIRQVIDQWIAQGGDASTLYSNLEKNEELKNILLQETPWVLAANDETAQKQRLSLLFDINRVAELRESAFRQLLDRQGEDGGWSWFKGFPGNRQITLSVLKGMAQLVQLNAVQYTQAEKEMQIKALKYLDSSIQTDYENLRKRSSKWQNNPPSPEQINYLYVRSFYRDIPELGEAREAIRFYTTQAGKSWNKQSLYSKGAIALLMHRNGTKNIAADILKWLKKTKTLSNEKGMFWANNRQENNYFTSPIETHCLLMAAFNEIAPDPSQDNRLKQWLLNQKRTQNWESAPATVNAIYALLLTGSDWLNENNACVAQWGNQTYNTSTQGEVATGYLKIALDRNTPETSGNNHLSIRKEGKAPAWGAVYEQYFQNIDEVKASKGALNVEKKLFVETNSGSERQIRPVTPDSPLRVGDKVIVRLTIRTDRTMEYVYLKDLRAGCFEPANPLSGSEYRDGAWFYRSPKDVSENFFFNSLPQGTYVLEYPVYVTRSGEYAGGISTIQCLYAPEFVSHTEGGAIQVSSNR